MTGAGSALAAAVRPTLAEDPAVRMAFTGRAEVGNVSLVVGGGDVAAARRDLAALVGLTPGQAVFMEQVHGSEVAVVGPESAGRGSLDHAAAVPAVDALVTAAPDLALVVMIADCVPLLLALPGRAVAAVHAGRRGVEGGVVARAVSALRAVGQGDSAEIVAVLGPAIGGCCYEVPLDVAEQVTSRHPAAAATTTWDTPSLDLPAAVTAQLGDAGVGRVSRVGGCTRCDPGHWFSHRADADGWAPGRQAGVILRAAATRGAARPSIH